MARRIVASLVDRAHRPRPRAHPEMRRDGHRSAPHITLHEHPDVRAKAAFAIRGGTAPGSPPASGPYDKLGGYFAPDTHALNFITQLYTGCSALRSKLDNISGQIWDLQGRI